MDSDQKLAEGTIFKIRLYAPTPGWPFSTDFPLVEGSRLIEMELPAFRGSVGWEYVFPIRGIYRLEVTAIDERREEVKKVFNFAIRENRLKLLYLGCFVVVLFLFGVMAGRLFTNRDRET
ncbi:MAG: hypothetical protein ACREQA_08095 [Candidatus Binatia bacterium]